MTPEQKTIARSQAEMDTDLFMDLLIWFYQKNLVIEDSVKSTNWKSAQTL